VLSFFVENNNAQIVWDVDAYYVNNNAQEAGTFFREYQKHSVLGKTFPDHIPSNFQEKITNQTIVHVIGAAQPVGQVKAMAQLLQQQLKNELKAEDTLIVLPDEKMLLPVLHSIPASADKLNVTMGFPLTSSTMFNFMELLFDLQITFAEEGFHHRPVLALLQHPYVIALTHDQTNSLRKHIIKQNWVHIPITYLREAPEFLQLIFQPANAQQLLSYFKNIIESIGQSDAIDDLDKEYAFHFYTFLNRLHDVLIDEMSVKSVNKKNEIKSFQRLFQQLAQEEKIPFAGEPLQGLQIMGVLETRNLDYKNVFILSLNEGSLPSGSRKGSYIPYNLRKAYGLPTAMHQDAMYAYLFYRVLQRAENVYLFYNTETDSLGQAEMSRYLQQLIFESRLNIQQTTLHNPIHPHPIQPIVIEKNQDILEALVTLSNGWGKHRGISPSALNTYLECRLKFYFRYIAAIREANEIEEDLDNRVLGDFLHKVLEMFYRNILVLKHSASIEPADLDNFEDALSKIIDTVFRNAYGLDTQKPVLYKGQRLVVQEIVKRFAQRIIELDKAYAPFQLEALEREGLTHEVLIDHAPHSVTLGGVVDRADRKGDVLRVVDYKTGRDELTFASIPSLFERGTKRNKAAFQTMIYAILFAVQLDKNESIQLLPGLINRKNLFDNAFQFGLRMGKEKITNVLPLLPEFKTELKTMLEELYNPEASFDQTSDVEVCKYCEFKSICYR